MISRLTSAALRRDEQQLPRAEHLWSWLNVYLPFMTAISIYLGGAIRFSGPSYSGPRGVMPWWAWALMFAVVGVFMALENYRGNVDRIAILNYICALPYIFLAVSFIGSLPMAPSAGTTGISVYFWVALMHIGLATLLPFRKK